MQRLDPLRVFLPYCAHRVGPNTYVLLGRDYKPVGCITEGWSHYEEHPITYEIEGLTPEFAADVSCSGSVDVERIYFFRDGREPWRGKRELKAYQKRLARFVELLVRKCPKRPHGRRTDERTEGGVLPTIEQRAL